MLSTRKFLKWRERHWVNFHFDEPLRGAREAPPPTFVFPTKFSIRMQEGGAEVMRGVGFRVEGRGSRD